MTDWDFSVLFSSVPGVESKYLNLEFRLLGEDDISCPWDGGTNFVLDGIFWRRTVISRNNTISKCSIFHFKAFPLINLQNFFVTWYNSQKWFELLHTVIPLKWNVFHYVTVKQYSWGRLQYINTERKKFFFCDPNTDTSTPAFFNTLTHHLEMVDVVMCLWGLTKLIKRFWSFRSSLAFSIYCSRWLRTQISWSGSLKITIDSRWCPGRDCFNNSGTKIVTLSTSNLIKSMFI